LRSAGEDGVVNNIDIREATPSNKYGFLMPLKNKLFLSQYRAPW
jgi:hypothetical protein